MRARGELDSDVFWVYWSGFELLPSAEFSPGMPILSNTEDQV